MNFIKNFFRKKDKNEIKENNYNFNYNNSIFKDKDMKLQEPETIAKFRLEKGAKDKEISKTIKIYNNYKSKIKNQWFNPSQSINSGWGNLHNSFYLQQQVNYYECMLLLQDPLMSKVINTLSTAPFKTFGTVEELDQEQNNKLKNIIYKYKLIEIMTKALKSSFVFGGCLMFLDTGTRHNLETPITETEKINIKQIKIIEPINIAPVEVNTINPAEKDYMKPTKYFIVGLGLVHSSRFIYFSQNDVPDTLKPMTLYFGFPLTELIKQDVANCNIVGQGIVEMMGRYRHKFMKVPREMFATEQVLNLQQRVKFDLNMADNFGVSLLADNEDLLQLQTQLSGLRENHEMAFQVLASKTSIPFTELMGTSAKGMDATGEGDRISWYDKIRNIRNSITTQLLEILYIFYKKENPSEEIEKFSNFKWDILEERKEQEKVEVLKNKMEIATNLVDMFGADPQKVLEWLQQDSLLNIKDLQATNGNNDITNEVLKELYKQEQPNINNDITDEVYDNLFKKEEIETTNEQEINKETIDITDKVWEKIKQNTEQNNTQDIPTENTDLQESEPQPAKQPTGENKEWEKKMKEIEKQTYPDLKKEVKYLTPEQVAEPNADVVYLGKYKEQSKKSDI